jgi:YfiR/HmsC-like
VVGNNGDKESRPRWTSGQENLRMYSKSIRALWLGFFLAVGPSAASPTNHDLAVSSEYTVKAAFLFHFSQFVEWPASTVPSPNSPLTYCTIGDDPFLGELDEALKGKTVGNHALAVQHLTARDQVDGCQILFIRASEKKRFSEVSAKAERYSILTVGESEHFTRDGGMIGFFLEDNKVRFDINLEATKRAKLKVSSRLLLLARNVAGSQ